MMVGITTLLAYRLVSIFRIKKQLKKAQLVEQNIYEAENLKKSFVLDFINPKSDISQQIYHSLILCSYINIIY